MAHGSKLLKLVESGDQVVIRRRGVPVALLAAAPNPPAVTLGFMPGDVNEEASLAPLNQDELRLWGGGLL
jgi:antitoxin (DNA-binding transcriptional repressor) of toxin-antitoxin stability system